jgi:hypothetical protein
MTKVFTGRDGRLLLGNDTLVKVTSWSLQAELETMETTTLGDAERNYVPGVKGFSGSAELIYYTDEDGTNDASTLLRKIVSTNAATTSDIATLTLRLVDGNSTKDVTLNTYITNASIGASVGEVCSAQISFKGTGALGTATI